MRLVLAFCTLLGLAGAAQAPLGFVFLNGARIAGEHSANKACNSICTRSPLLTKAWLSAVPGHTGAVRRAGRSKPHIFQLLAVDSIIQEQDEWNSWAMMKETAEEGSDDGRLQHEADEGLRRMQLHGNLQDTVVDPILKEVDEWDSWATMKDTAEKGSDGLQQLHGNLQDTAGSEEDEETDAALQKKQGRVSRYLQEADSRKEVEALKEHLALKDSAVEESNMALEDDPRAVHVPAALNTASDDSSELLGSAFGQMGLSVELCRALKEMNINTPTPIQKASLPVSLAGESVLLCAETGSGKSLAFLLPLVARLKNDELALGIKARPKRPRAIVLAPTRELAAQLLGVAKGLSRYAKFSSVGVLGGSSMAAQAKKLLQPVDLLVATPGRLLDLVKDGHVSLGDVRFVVADEADTMASQGFGAELGSLLSSVVAAADAARESFKKSAELSAKMLSEARTEEEMEAVETQLKVVRGPFHPKDRGHVQCVLAAATVAQAVTSIIQSTFPKTRQIKTEMAHKVPDGLFQEFVSVTSGDRALRLLEVLDRGRRMNMDRYAAQRDSVTSRDATIIFCNTKDSALFAAKLLRENDYEVAEGHGWVAQHERLVQMEEFMNGKKKILVATDVVARGIDTVNVAHVINFDFPLNPVDYIHRIGRTGRGGGTGRVTNLVTKRDYTLAMAIERATKLGHSIEALSSKKTDYVQGKPGMLKAEAGVRSTESSSSSASASAVKPRRSGNGAPKLGKGGIPLPLTVLSKKKKPKDTTMKSWKTQGQGKKGA